MLELSLLPVKLFCVDGNWATGEMMSCTVCCILCYPPAEHMNLSTVGTTCIHFVPKEKP